MLILNRANFQYTQMYTYGCPCVHIVWTRLLHNNNVCLQVFQELQTYDLTLEQDSDSEFWTARPRGRRRSRRSAMWWQTAHTKDAQFAFEVLICLSCPAYYNQDKIALNFIYWLEIHYIQESGVLVMTDKVRLNFREEPVAFPGLMFHRPGPGNTL